MCCLFPTQEFKDKMPVSRSQGLRGYHRVPGSRATEFTGVQQILTLQRFMISLGFMGLRAVAKGLCARKYRPCALMDQAQLSFVHPEASAKPSEALRFGSQHARHKLIKAVIRRCKGFPCFPCFS